jgi:plastocyanin
MIHAIASVSRRIGVSVMFMLVAAAAAHRVAAAAEPPATVRVDITKFTFAPREIDIRPGTRVVWTNRDQVPHTVTGNDKSFGSKGLDTDDTFEQVFTREGDFAYICAVHPFMTGVVHVRNP